MKKKIVITVLVVAVVLIGVALGGFFLLPKENKEDARDEKGEAFLCHGHCRGRVFRIQ